jgi:hypothetical protein
MDDCHHFSYITKMKAKKKKKTLALHCPTGQNPDAMPDSTHLSFSPLAQSQRTW